VATSRSDRYDGAMSVVIEDIVVVAQGSLLNLKEMMRALEGAGVDGQVLPPADGCHNR
jgi:hypothetical protein